MSGPMARAAEAWWGWIAPVSLQAAILLLLVALLDRILRGRAPARVRMALWLAALARLALPACLRSPASLTAPLAAALPSGEAVPAGAGPLLLLWGAGVALVLVAWARREASVLRSVLAADAVLPADPVAVAALAAAASRAGLRRAPALRVSRAVEGPCVAGTLRPLVVIPPEAADLAPALLHECVHLRRRDPWARALVRLAAAVFWFHPLVWIAARRTEALREACCDGSVAEILGPETAGYREALLRAAERLLRTRRGIAPSLGLLGGGDGLADRIRALEGRPWRGARVRAAAALGAGAFVLGCLAPMAAPHVLPVPGTDGTLAEARAVLERAARGERQSCWSVRFAGWRLAQEDGTLAATAGTSGKGGRP